MYARAFLADGTQVVSEFSQLRGIGRYANEVLSGRKGFNVWRPSSQSTHPHSGERVLYRSRQVISGRHILAIEQVEPLPGQEENHNYDPQAFRPVIVMKSGSAGTWVAPESEADRVDGAVPGAEYPMHRDEVTRERYVILRAPGEDGEGAVLHYPDRERYGRSAGYDPATEEAEEDDWVEDEREW